MAGHRIVPRTYSRPFEQSTFSFEKMTRTGRRGFPVAEPHKLEHAVPPNFSSSFSPRGGCLLASTVLSRHRPFLFFLFVPLHVMKTVTKDGVTSVVAQNEVVIPDLTIKDLLSAIPSVALPSLHVALCCLQTFASSRPRCFQRSALRS